MLPPWVVWQRSSRTSAVMIPRRKCKELSATYLDIFRRYRLLGLGEKHGEAPRTQCDALLAEDISNDGFAIFLVNHVKFHPDGPLLVLPIQRLNPVHFPNRFDRQGKRKGENEFKRESRLQREALFRDPPHPRSTNVNRLWFLEPQGY